MAFWPKLGWIALAVLLAACGNGTASSDELRVVATTGILGDVVGSMVEDDATLDVLIPNGADPHDYRASAQQAASILTADLVVANGLLLEEGLLDLLAQAEADGVRVLQVGDSLDPIMRGQSEIPDPHFWLDPMRMADAAKLIASELITKSPDVDWNQRASNYAAELQTAHQEITATLSTVPEDQRKLVTNHDALAYFASRYGFEIVGTVIPGGSGLADPSPAELTALVEIIRREDVKAIFTETTESSSLAQELADEFGGEVSVVELYTGSLGEPGSGADTLVGMLVSNATLIAEALS
ncbi:MAG: metal ABC transporter substrate-binding protein [Acidimicrobiia bacterium]|nr:metal ABC transporter substrate-binding protein [Acidimicrobiia bacterium]NNC44177.1 zinc ABC transporter substrate-binding protein [Acidimicrobiia bacterium]NND14685.1 zinc ABC transporter substrate-binding protein [Acidimicrobiia bacterium]